MEAGQPDVFDLIEEMYAWLVALRRAGAGYRSLHGSLMSLSGQPAEVERRRWLPLFKFPASLNGRESIECVADLKKVDPQHVQHVLNPLIHSQAMDMVEAVEELYERFRVVRPAVHRMAGLDPQQSDGKGLP
jgi:hypothetical protein